MKKNLTKLALSGAALAAVAATLGTSTYAWYTTNPTVNANNIIGASADSGASSIYIAKETGSTKNWRQTVDLTAESANFATLTPAQPSGTTGTFNNLAGTTTADVIKVQLYFKTSKTANPVNLYLKSISITNSTTTLGTADNLLAGQDGITEGAYGVASTDGTYFVDFTRALGMQIDAGEGAADQTFDLTPYHTGSYKTHATAKTVTNGKAHAYYNQVMPQVKVKDTNNKMPGDEGYTDTYGPALSDAAITAGKNLTGTLSKAPIAVLPAAGTPVEVDFYVYLNGWSDFCYDACQGQQFTLNMSFTSEVDNAIGA